MNPEERGEASNKVSEYRKLNNKIKRYQGRIFEEALKNDAEFLIRSTNGDLKPFFTMNGLIPDLMVILDKDERGIIDETPLVDLARQTIPSLCRRYQEAIERYIQLIPQIEKMPYF